MEKLKPDPRPLPVRYDSRGRLNHLRFEGDFVILFWIDHAEKAVQVLEIGWQ